MFLPIQGEKDESEPEDNGKSCMNDVLDYFKDLNTENGNLSIN